MKIIRYKNLDFTIYGHIRYLFTFKRNSCKIYSETIRHSTARMKVDTYASVIPSVNKTKTQ